MATQTQSVPISELVHDLTEQTTTLVRQEIALARAEITHKGKEAGVGVGMLSAAGVIGMFMLGTLVAAVVLALSTAVAAWLAALIVAGALGVIAAVLALTGKNAVSHAAPPIPEDALNSTKEDVMDPASGTAVSNGTSTADKSPEQLREDIEHTREQLGETVAMLSAKADVKARVHEKAEHAKERVSGLRDTVAGASPDSARQVTGEATAVVRRNPLPAAVVAALVAGFVVGRLTAGRG